MIRKYKSPVIYMGGKYDILEYIDAVLPKEINTFYDVFGGSFNVGGNITAKNIVYNDVNPKISELISYLYNHSSYDIISNIENRINNFGLVRRNTEIYRKFREEYNNKQNPLDLFILHCYSFMHGFMFNLKGMYNCPCGDSEYNSKTRENIINFCNHIQQKTIKFYNENFECVINSAIQSKTIGNDVIYCDPPYITTYAFYNISDTQWTEDSEKRLYELLKQYSDKGGLFVVSNVFKHRNKENPFVIEFSKDYNVYHIKNKKYRKVDQKFRTIIKTDQCETDEVLITNIENSKNLNIFKYQTVRNNLW